MDALSSLENFDKTNLYWRKPSVQLKTQEDFSAKK